MLLEGSGVVCPVCGEPITFTKARAVSGRRYLYAVHYDYATHKVARECSLGPESDYVVPDRQSFEVALRRTCDAQLLRALLTGLAVGSTWPAESLLKVHAEYAARAERLARRLDELLRG